MAVPIFVMQVYDRVVFYGGVSTLATLVIGVACVLAFDYIMRQARARILQTIALCVGVQTGRRLFDKLMTLPLHVLESRSAAHWHTLFRDVEIVRNTASGASALLMCDLPFAVLFLVLTFVIAAPIAWVMFLILATFLLIAWRSGQDMAVASDAERTSTLARDDLISAIVAGRSTIKALALEKAMRPLWPDLNSGPS